MKKLLIFMSAFLISITLIGCDPSSVTIPPALSGEKDITIEVGTEFTDPGLSNYSEGVTVEGEVDTSTLGDYTITYSVVSNEVTLSISRTVHVVDTTLPVVTLIGGDVTINEGGTFTDEGATAEDNYDGVITEIVVDDFVDEMTPGTYSVIYSATDSSGNIGTATRTVTVAESTNTAPTVSLVGEASITIYLDSVYVDAGATANDTEDGVITSDIVTTGAVDSSTVGVYTITYDVMDSEGLAATTITRTVTVVENQQPVLTLIGEAVINLFVGEVYNELGASANDFEDNDLTSDIVISGTVDMNTAGTYIISYNVSDTEGLAADVVTRSVVVTVNAVPVITLLGDATVIITEGDTYTDAGATAFDTEDGDITASITAVGNVNVMVPGSYQVTYYVADTFGQGAVTVIRVVIVEPANTAPVVILLGDAQVIVILGETFTDSGATASDTEDGDLTSSIVVSGTVDVNTIGTYTISYDVIDNDSLAAVTVTRTVIVKTNDAPVITLLGDSDMELLVGETFADPGFTASDTEDGDVTASVEVTGTVDTTTVGTYVVTYTYTDTDANLVSVTRTIKVKPASNTIPELQLNGDTALFLQVGDTFVDPGAIAIDVEDGDISANIIVGGTVDTSTVGVYTLSYTITDNDSNTVTIFRTVAVEQPTNELPHIQVNAPVEIHIMLNDTFTIPTAMAADFEDGDLTSIIIITEALDTSVVGSYDIVYSVTDSDLNTVTVTITVTVQDNNQAPEIFINGFDEMTAYVADNWFDPGATASDVEDGDLTLSITVVDTVDTTTPGIYYVTYTVTDSGGLTEEMMRKVTVLDFMHDTLPEVTLIGDALMTVNQNTVVIDPGATAWDDQDGDITENVWSDWDNVVDLTTPGVYQVMYYISDSDFNTNWVYRTVTVVEYNNTLPVITLNGPSEVTILEGDVFIDLGATATDTEDGDLTAMITVMSPLDVFAPGSYPISYTVKDLDGAIATVIRIVHVLPTYPPEVTLNGDALVILNVFDSWVDPGATALDAEDGPISSRIFTTGSVDLGIPGEYTIAYTVIDTDGKMGVAFRKVIVVNNIAGTYGTVVIERGLDIDWVGVLNDLGLDPTTIITIDTDIIGDTFLVIDGQGVLFKVYENQFNTVSVTPGTLFYIPSQERLDVILAVYDKQVLQVEGMNALHSSLFAGIGYGIDVITHQSSMDYMRQAIFEEGYYNFYINQLNDGVGQLSFSIASLGLIHNESINIPLNDYVYIFEEDYTEELMFNAAGGNLEISFYMHNPYIVTITDSLGNVIIESRGQGYYTLVQHFASGDYDISIQMLDEPGTLTVFITDVITDNFGYIYADELLLETVTTLNMMPQREWYYVNIVTAGYYHFELLESSSQFLDFTLFTNQLGKIDSYKDDIYLEPGMYYIRLQGTYGEITINIEEIVMTAPVITTNNDKQSAITLIDGDIIDVLFDDINYEKWYTITLTEETLTYFEIESYLHETQIGIMIYDDQDNLLYSFNEHDYQTLQAGTFYVKLVGLMDDESMFLYKTFMNLPGSIDEETPTVLTVDETYMGFGEEGINEFFEITIPTDGIYQFDFEGVGRALLISLDDMFIFEGHLYTNDMVLVPLQAGTYQFKLMGTHMDAVYSIRLFESNDLVNGFSYHMGDAPFKDPYQVQYIYVYEPGTSVYQKILIDEAQVLYAHPENIQSMTVYDEEGHVVANGNPYSIFPLLVMPGVYTFEYVSDYPGYIWTVESWRDLVYDYGKDFDSATVLDDLEVIRGYVNGETVDTIEFTLTEQTLINLNKWNEFDVLLLDSNHIVLKEYTYWSGGSVLLEAGTYYVVVNQDSGFYMLSLMDITYQLLADNFTDAAEVYVQEDFTGYIQDVHSDGFVKFIVTEDSILDFNFGTDRFVIYDGAMTEYYESLFTPGTYYIKFYTINSNEYNVDDVIMVSGGIYNIGGKIVTNDMASAITISADVNYESFSPLYGQEAWYTFTVEEDQLTWFHWNGEVNAGIYNAEMDLIGFAFTPFEYEPGTYYIKVFYEPNFRTKELEAYSFRMYQVDYIDPPSTCALAETIDLTSGGYTLNGYFLGENDIDCFKFNIGDLAYIRFSYYGNFDLTRVGLDDSYMTSIWSGNIYIIESEPFFYLQIKENMYSSAGYYINVYNESERFVPETFAEAREIVIGDYIRAYRMLDTEIDHFKFTVDHDLAYTVNTNHSFTLYDINEVEYQSNILVAGTYYITFEPDWTGNYDFTILELVDNDGGGGIDPIYEHVVSTYEEPIVLLNDFFTLKVPMTEGYNSSDFYQIELTEGIFYQIRDNKWGNRIQIFDEDDVRVVDAMYYDWQPVVVYLEPGIYIIEISDCFDYDITFAENKYIDYSGDALNPYDLFIYEKVYSYLFDGLDKDYFTFTLDEDSILELQYEGNAYIEIFDALDALVLTTENVFSAILPAGEYSMVVHNYDGGISEYNLAIRLHNDAITNTVMFESETVPVMEEFNRLKFFSDGTTPLYVKIILDRDTFLELTMYDGVFDSTGAYIPDPTMLPAGTYYIQFNPWQGISYLGIRDNTDHTYLETSMTQLELDMVYSVFAKYDDEIDTWQYTPTTDELIFLSKFMGYEIYITVKNSLDEIIFESNYDMSNYWNRRFSLEAGETYTIEMTDIDTFYQFSFTSYEFTDYPDTEAEAFVVFVEDEMLHGNLFSLEDEDWYTFTLTSDTTLTGLQGVIYDLVYPDTTVYTNTQHNTSDMTLQAGTYYLRVYGLDNASYSVDLIEIEEAT